jgi:hypothetical protein
MRATVKELSKQAGKRRVKAGKAANSATLPSFP